MRIFSLAALGFARISCTTEGLHPRLYSVAALLTRSGQAFAAVPQTRIKKVGQVGQERPTSPAFAGEGARATLSSSAFFRVGFYQFFGQDYEAEDLGPFGDDVAGDLSPF